MGTCSLLIPMPGYGKMEIREEDCTYIYNIVVKNSKQQDCWFFDDLDWWYEEAVDMLCSGYGLSRETQEWNLLIYTTVPKGKAKLYYCVLLANTTAAGFLCKNYQVLEKERTGYFAGEREST